MQLTPERREALQIYTLSVLHIKENVYNLEDNIKISEYIGLYWKHLNQWEKLSILFMLNQYTLLN